jgi:NADH dehydrogenase
VDLINQAGVQIGENYIFTQNVFWAAGVQAAKFNFIPEIKTDRSHRVLVNTDFSIRGYPDVFVIGDMALYDLGDGKFLPGLAPVAMQAGKYVAQAILNSVNNEPREKFEYLDKGQLATIGKRKAIGEIFKLKIHGYFAWLAWFFVHILYLVGFRNKLVVSSQWIWSYIFSKRGARLITEREWRLSKQQFADANESAHFPDKKESVLPVLPESPAYGGEADEVGSPTSH